MKIGLFDSGIGGVTVLRELQKLLPRADFCYFSDSANNPYGDKTEAEITALSLTAGEFLAQQGCEIVVIACNTASAASKTALREALPVPVVAIEPAYKMAYDFDNSEQAKDASWRTVLMATESTVKSQKFQDLVAKYPDDTIDILGCRGLAEKIENGLDVSGYLREKLAPYRGKVSGVVLGCTHYPLIKAEITAALGCEVKFFDGATGVARRVAKILGDAGDQGSSKVDFYDSSKNPAKKARFLEILGESAAK